MTVLIEFIAAVLLLTTFNAVAQAQIDASVNTPLNITALSVFNGVSVLECWSLESLPIEARGALNYAIGSTTGATWSLIPPETTVGEAWAPSPQLTIVLNGLVSVTTGPFTNQSGIELPCASTTNTTAEDQTRTVYFQPGTLRSTLLIAADTKATAPLRGHYTAFPGSEQTILVQLPFANGTAPEHVVLGLGDCSLFA